MLSFFSHLVLNPLCILLRYSEAVVRKCSVKRLFLNILQNSEENTCARVSFYEKLQVDYCRKEVAAHVFSYKIYEIFKNIFFKEHLRTTGSGYEVFSRNFLHIFQKHLELFEKDFFCNNKPLFAVGAWLSYIMKPRQVDKSSYRTKQRLHWQSFHESV